MSSDQRGPLRPADPRRLGGYRLESRLGEGGMGTVYLGHDRDGRPVAIKVIKPEYACEEEFRARFRSEVNRARQVPPFCTAELLDADADHETPYLVVEYIDGPSLAEVIAEHGPLTGGSLYSVAVGIATALAAIHGAGVIHRDLKPQNVLFSLGTPKVIDFGIARAFEATSHYTGPDQMVGTVAYMAPERFDVNAGQIVGPAADVFAWGVVVAYAGAGRTPFAGDSAAATAACILTQPPSLSGVPAPLRDLVARTLEKDPGRRPSAFELLDLLLAAGTQDAPVADSLASRPELRRVAQAARRSGPQATRGRHRGDHSPAAQHGTGVASRRWRRTAPAIAAAAIVATAAAGLLTFTPSRQLLLGQEPGAGSTSEPAPNDSAPAAAPTPTAVRLCRSADTGITITAQSDNPTAVGAQTAIISLVNKSGTPCRVDGRVYLRLYNAADEPVAVKTETVDQPDRAVEMVLRPNGGAFQGIKWEACDRSDGDCPTGNTVRGGLEASADGVVATLEGFPAAVRSAITMSSLQLGTLQPSPQGTVAW